MIWYAIRTAPQRELYAEKALREAGHVTFCPTMRRSARRRDGRRHEWTTAMLPSYVFCADVVPWLEIRSAAISGRRLMLGVLGPDGIPSPIPAESIEAIRKFDGAPQPVQTLQPGDEITIRLGRHDIRRVKVSAIDHGRIQVALLMLGAWRLVDVRQEQVEAA